MESTLSSITGDGTKQELIKSQLRTIKQRFNVSRNTIHFIRQGRQLTTNELKQMLVPMIEQYVAPSVSASPSSASASAAAAPSHDNAGHCVGANGAAPNGRKVGGISTRTTYAADIDVRALPPIADEQTWSSTFRIQTSVKETVSDVTGACGAIVLW